MLYKLSKVHFFLLHVYKIWLHKTGLIFKANEPPCISWMVVLFSLELLQVPVTSQRMNNLKNTSLSKAWLWIWERTLSIRTPGLSVRFLSVIVNSSCSLSFSSSQRFKASWYWVSAASFITWRGQESAGDDHPFSPLSLSSTVSKKKIKIIITFCKTRNKISVNVRLKFNSLLPLITALNIH